jgi:hypothetical protein
MEEIVSKIQSRFRQALDTPLINKHSETFIPLLCSNSSHFCRKNTEQFALLTKVENFLEEKILNNLPY